MTGGEKFEVRRIIRQDQATAEANRCCHDESVDGHFAPRSDAGEEVTSGSGNPDPRRDHPRIPPVEFCVDGVIETRASIQLEQHRRWDAHRLITALRGSHGRSDSFMADRG
jgi:hypothetical protein